MLGSSNHKIQRRPVHRGQVQMELVQLLSDGVPPIEACSPTWDDDRVSGCFMFGWEMMTHWNAAEESKLINLSTTCYHWVKTCKNRLPSAEDPLSVASVLVPEQLWASWAMLTGMTVTLKTGSFDFVCWNWRTTCLISLKVDCQSEPMGSTQWRFPKGPKIWVPQFIHLNPIFHYKQSINHPLLKFRIYFGGNPIYHLVI